MTEYQWDERCADLELSRLQRGFTGLDHTAFGTVLLGGFLDTQAAIHVETGTLRASGRADVGTTNSSHWEGEIGYGGAFRVGNKVAGNYAWSEYFGRSPRYGGPPSHNWMLSTVGIEDPLTEAAEAFFDRGHFTPHPEGRI